MRRLWDLRSADRGALRGAVLPHRGGRRGVAGHGVARVGTVLQRNFAVFVQLLELGSPVLEPDLDLREKKMCTLILMQRKNLFQCIMLQFEMDICMLLSILTA